MGVGMELKMKHLYNPAIVNLPVVVVVGSMLFETVYYFQQLIMAVVVGNSLIVIAIEYQRNEVVYY